MNTRISNQPPIAGVTRRTFLAGAGVGALGIAAAGMFGCSPQSDAPQQQASAAEEPKQTSAGATTVEMTETVEADVVVIGTGVSGLTAAISAAESGAKVTVLEKLDGLKKIYAHSITAIGTSFQKELGEDWTPEELVAFWNQYPDSDSFMDTEAQLFAAQHSAESIEWLIEHGVDIVGVTVPPTNPFQVPARTFVTSADRDGVKAYLEPLKAKAEELGVEFRFSTEATKIVTDDSGAVTGVETVSGNTGTLFNLKSLIVAAGGFGGSPDMLRLYAPHTPNCSTFDGESQGFALSQAKTVSADVVAPGGTMAYFVNVDGGYGDNPGQGMFVNREGKRWVNENLYFLDRAGIAYKQGITEYWALYDSTLYEQVAAGTGEKALEAGSIVKADTIEELAKKMNVNVAALKKTVEDYNGYCEAGEDPDFGKPAVRMGRVFDPEDTKEYDLDLVEREFTLLNPLATAPFYAIDMTVQTTALSGTTGGMRTNTDGEVIDVEGKVIPNLYAVGESANGHLIGYFYPQSGTSLCMCFCFGRYAGAAAAANAAS
ncbi:FAD-dependent oxidoreductase [Raoultibacter massiliensis]|uniref:FAD-dependent oxidoreductase n=1 Tax=Raoultibacter massiliensis TaxID=1852371 RepID=UPI003A8ECA67